MKAVINNLAVSQNPKFILQNQLYFYILTKNNWKRIKKNTICSRMKYLYINLREYMQHWNTDSYKTLLGEISEAGSSFPIRSSVLDGMESRHEWPMGSGKGNKGALALPPVLIVIADISRDC